MKNIIRIENFSQRVNETEIAINEEPKAEGPDERLFTAQGPDKAFIKKKAHDDGKKAGFPNITDKIKLTGTTDAKGNPGPPFTYKVVMSKSLPKE